MRRGSRGANPWQALLEGRVIRPDNNMACSSPLLTYLYVLTVDILVLTSIMM